MFDTFDAILDSDAPDIDKLKLMFEWTTQRFLEGCERDIELARAMKDRESTIRAQMRLEVMKSARGIFDECYTYLAQRGR